MKMLAAVMHQQGLPAPFVDSEPFRIEDVDLEGPGEGEVLVEVRSAGLCHSDLTTVEGKRARRLPVIGGHEGAGIVAEVGAGVTSLKPGDHVVMTSSTGCGCCRPCINSRPALCDSVMASRRGGLLANGARRLSLNGGDLFHYSGISSFAQYAVTMPGTLIKIDPEVPLDVAAMFGCGVVTGAGAVFNTARVRPGQVVAIFGLGGVGLSAVMAARIAGALMVIGIDINEGKFPLAQELGCTHVLNARDPELVTKIRDMTMGGVDYALEVSGVQAAMESAYAITCKGGEVIGVGVAAFSDMYKYPHTMLVVEEKAIRGSSMGGGIAERDIPVYARMFKEGKMPVDKLMSRTMRFGELNAALDALDRGEVVRQILTPHAA